MGFEWQTIFNRKLLPVITVRNITLVLGVAPSEVANRERFNIVTGLELNQQRWLLRFCPSRLSVAATVEVRWITSICFESIGYSCSPLEVNIWQASEEGIDVSDWQWQNSSSNSSPEVSVLFDLLLVRQTHTCEASPWRTAIPINSLSMLE